MADVVVKVLNMYSIRDSINCITADNTTVNDGIFLDLEPEMREWFQENSQIRCLAHVLNLAAQTVLKTLRSEGEGLEVVLAADDQRDLLNNTVVDPATTLHKLYQILAKIRSSNLLGESLQEDAQRKRLNWLVPILMFMSNGIELTRLSNVLYIFPLGSSAFSLLTILTSLVKLYYHLHYHTLSGKPAKVLNRYSVFL